MKRVEVRLNLDAVAPLLDVIKGVADRLEPELAIVPQVPEHDEELAGEWKAELLAGQRSDLAVLLGLFDAEFFATGMIALDPENAEPVLRATAALRLRLRAMHLAWLEDEKLESGDVALEGLTGERQRAFAAYVFLATLQEVVVHHLDPSAGD